MVLVFCAALLSLPAIWLAFSGPGPVRFESDARIERSLPGAPRAETGAAMPATVIARRPVADPDLVEPSPFGPLPRVAAHGQRPFFAYASPFDFDDSRPKVAILVLGLGLQERATEAALALPAGISLQFSPYAPDLDRDVTRARRSGHEVLLALPMEPPEYPLSDPGPHTLLASAGSAGNLDRLHWVLSRTRAYVGVAGDGRRFAASDAAGPVVADLAARGLALVEVGSDSLTGEAQAAGMPYASAAAPIDEDPSPLTIDHALAELEAQALESGSALGVISALPVSMARLAVWIDSLQTKGLALAPLSALLIEGGGPAQIRGEGEGVAGEPGHG